MNQSISYFKVLPLGPKDNKSMLKLEKCILTRVNGILLKNNAKYHKKHTY